MKKSLLIVAIILASTLLVHAKENTADQAGATTNKEWRKGYLNLCYAPCTLTPKDQAAMDCKYGAALTYGRTFYLHKPIAKESLRFGIDATWFDLNYTNYRASTPEKEYQLHQVEYSLHVGPSLTVVLGKKFKLFGYFRYCPTFSAFYDMRYEDFFGNYAHILVGGGSISYGPIGLGAEARWGCSNYKALSKSNREPYEVNMNGWRAYLSFKI